MGTLTPLVPTVSRSAEVARLGRILEKAGVFAKAPPGAREFIAKHYAHIPYHGPLHPYMMLAYILSCRLLDPVLLAMICGHDAGHNGIASESPEEISAIHTYAWLTRRKTLESLGSQYSDKKDLARVVAVHCRDTQFPYRAPAVGKYGIWLRTADVLSSLLTPPEFLGVERETWSPFRVFLYLNLPFYLERQGAEFKPSISDWMWQKQEDGSFMGQVCDALDRRYFVVANVDETRKLLMRCRESMRFLSGQPDRLESWLEFLRGDVTLPEFLELTRDLGL